MGESRGRHLAAIMFTDIAGYTAMMQRDEAAAVEARARHRAALASSVSAHGGEIFQFLGDGGVSVFPSAVEAVRAGIQVQAELAGPPRLPLRIGIHQGEITYDEQGIVGDSVNISARVQTLSEPGGIVITAKVHDEIRNHPDLAAIGLGAVRLKGVERAVQVFAVKAPGVASPDDRAEPIRERTTIHARVLRHRAVRPVVDRATSAPMPVTAFVGRDTELSAISDCLDATAKGQGRTLLLRGERGVGKTRLSDEARRLARSRGWDVVVGRASPVETDWPYALCAHALLPRLRSMSEEARARLTEVVGDELAVVFPTLASEEPGARKARPESPDFRSRLFWNLAQVLVDLAQARPLLVILEDLHWADTSSLELLHFLARQTADTQVAFLCSYRDDAERTNRRLGEIEDSLVSLRVASVHVVRPLTFASTDKLLRQTFNVPAAISRSFTSLLYDSTRGNPFFIEEVLKSLVASGELRRETDAWIGWDIDELRLPESVRAAVLDAIGRLSEPAKRIADLVAVLGGRSVFAELRAASSLSHQALLPLLEELERQHVLVDASTADAVAYEFWHPIVGETIYAELGRARAGLLHGTVARSLEEHYAESALEHAGILAYHYARAVDQDLADKAVRYLEAAGRSALAAYANPEALKYFRTALDRSGSVVRTPRQTADLISRLAHAHQRTGDTQTAIERWKQALAMLEAAGDAVGVSRVQRHLGLAHYWTGRAAQALGHFDAGIEAALSAGDRGRLAMLQVARGLCLQELGRPDDALRELRSALEEAQRSQSGKLLARVHRALLLIYLWTGPPAKAAAHGALALEFAASSDDTVLSFWVHWAMAVLAGLTGDAASMTSHLGHCNSVAEQLRSPLLRMWAAEIAIEYAFGRGSWDEGLAIGENAISMARVLGQYTLLPRLLVWTGLIYLGRHDLERGRVCVDEAWRLATGTSVDSPVTDPHAEGSRAAAVDAGGPESSPTPATIHAVIPAHIGRATYLLTTERYEDAIATAEAALSIVDQTGYDVWAVHRLLPIAAEASLYLHDVDRAARFGERLRVSAERFDNQLGLAWADACDAITIWLKGDPVRGSELMRTAVDALEAVPFLPDATRLRRQLAGRLAEIGDREGALRELRHVHDTLRMLGADRELERTRSQFRELDEAAPELGAASAPDGLQQRE